jgi:thiol-disulfide isomerase/thioredoxin
VAAKLPFETIDFDTAQARAIERGRYLVVASTGASCPPCRMMERATWPSKLVRAWLAAHAVCIRFDTDEDPELAKRLSIESNPTVIAFRDGRELDRVVGARDPAPLVAWLEGVRAGRTETDVLRDAVAANPNDVDARYALADIHMQAGRCDEALAELLWLWEHVLEHRPSMVGVRSSFMLGEIGDLITVHPPARVAFAAIRDREEEALRSPESDASDFIDLCVALDEEDRVLRWLDGPGAEILGRDRVPGTIVHRVAPILVERGRWDDLCRLYEGAVPRLRERHQQMTRTFATMPPNEEGYEVEEMREASFDTIRSDAARMSRAFRMAGRADEADAIVAEVRRLLPGEATERSLLRAAAED